MDAKEFSSDIDTKSQLEFLRVATMIGQKIDFIWMTFLTTYITLFGFAIFYSGGVRVLYFLFILVATSMFTWINFLSLWHHYRLQNEMGRIFTEMNNDFPTLAPYMKLYNQPKSERVLILTHASGFATFVIFVFDKFRVWERISLFPDNY